MNQLHTQSIEYTAGQDYAEWLRDNDQEGTQSVMIEEVIQSTLPIPDGDYNTMIQAGIENPDPAKYWEGFNSVFA